MSKWLAFVLLLFSATGGALVHDWLAPDAGCTTLVLEKVEH